MHSHSCVYTFNAYVLWFVCTVLLTSLVTILVENDTVKSIGYSVAFEKITNFDDLSSDIGIEVLVLGEFYAVYISCFS